MDQDRAAELIGGRPLTRCALGRGPSTGDPREDRREQRPGTRSSSANAVTDLVDLPEVLVSRADAEDVGQSVWLRLVDQLDKIRDPSRAARVARYYDLLGKCGRAWPSRTDGTRRPAHRRREPPRTSRPTRPARTRLLLSATRRCARRSPSRCCVGQRLIAALIAGTRRRPRRDQRQAGIPYSAASAPAAAAALQATP